MQRTLFQCDKRGAVASSYPQGVMQGFASNVLPIYVFFMSIKILEKHILRVTNIKDHLICYCCSV